MIRNGEGWHYLADKILPALLKGMLSHHGGDFYCLNFLPSFRTEDKLESVKIKIFVLWCHLKTKVSELNQYLKSNKVPPIIYGDLRSLIKEVNGCKNNPKNSSTTKIVTHIPCRYSVSVIWAFDGIENKHHNVYKGWRFYLNILWMFKGPLSEEN